MDVDATHQQVDKAVLVENDVVVEDLGEAVVVAALALESLIVAFLSHWHSQVFWLLLVHPLPLEQTVLTS